jgi:hypothetical protein
MITRYYVDEAFKDINLDTHIFMDEEQHFAADECMEEISIYLYCLDDQINLITTYNSITEDRHSLKNKNNYYFPPSRFARVRFAHILRL